ncbi:Xenobiotic-transporting_ATPase / Multidrug resistance-associated protein [Hexamita inflata]|uniref:Xenobiotic-transporting ATPase / Multidrug resistance-associated protein n=1 Tax=Hexamita inflata TaxID=28002 RepID=A0AA86RA71_9EUKA|nr:Xenobiotic-transporting ATPase / Multidrug resistance-associated protein [Hexamita inflata]
MDFTWSWVKPILSQTKGNQVLKYQNVIPLMQKISLPEESKNTMESMNSNPQKSLLRHLLHAGKKHIIAIFCAIPLLGLSLAAVPFCINMFQTHLQAQLFFDCDYYDNTAHLSKVAYLPGLQRVFEQLYPYLILIFVSRMVYSIADSFGALHGYRMSIKVVSTLTELIFQKTLKLNSYSKNQGNLINLMFMDTFKVQLSSMFFHNMLVIPIEVIISVIYLGTYVNPISLSGVGLLFVFVPMIYIFSIKLQQSLDELNNLRDSRCQKIQEMLNGIKVIKLFNTEAFFEKKIDNARKKEMWLLWKALKMVTGTVTIGFTSYSIMSALSFGVLILCNKLDLTESFTMIFLFTNLQNAMEFFPAIVLALQDTFVSLKRLQQYFSLSQVNTNYLTISESAENAIEINGTPSFAYHKEVFNEAELESTKNELKQTSVLLNKQILKYLKIKSNRTTPFYEEIKKCVELQVVQFDASLANKVASHMRVPEIQSTSIYSFAPSTKKCLLNAFYDLQVIKQLLSTTTQQVPSVHELDFCVKKGQLIGLQGQVGSGKSSIFNAILGEMNLVGTGNISICGKVAFCPQNSPIFASTIRENICFYQPYDEAKYNRIVDICCLNPDFEIFNARDLTEVGGKGVTLSGGQRARICLARAIYNDADIYLLDDPLSAVDAHVGKRIWNEVVVGYLVNQGKTVLIASHQTHYFKDCDRIFAIENGRIVADDVQLESQRETSSQPEKSVPIVLSQAIVTEEDGKLVEDEQAIEGKIKMAVYMNYFKMGSKGLVIGFAVFTILYQVLNQMSSVVLSNWMADKYGWSSSQSLISQDLQNNITLNENIFGDKEYVKQATLTCVKKNDPAQAEIIEQIEKNFSLKYYWLYIGLVAGVIIFFTLLNLCFFWYNTTTAQNQYRKQFSSVIRTKLAFFDTTPQGRIIHRLVRDTESVDYTFGRFFCLATNFISVIAGIMITICITSWPCIFIVVPSLIFYGIIFDKFRRIIPQVKRFESIARSSTMTIAQEVVDNVEFIRAYNVQGSFQQKFRSMAEMYIQFTWLGNSLTKWVLFRLSLLGGAFAVLVTIACMIITPYSPDIAQYTGLIVAQSFSLQYLIISAIDLFQVAESEVPAIERIQQFASLPRESDEFNNRQQKQVSDEKVEGLNIDNIVMRYRPELQPALKGVDLKIKPREHVAVVGRTGSGKSSLVASLFNLYNPENGVIQLDDVVLNNLNLYEQRRQFAVIPQEPYLFSGTLRQQLCEYTQHEAENLDTATLTRVPDQKLWELLNTVQLDDYIRSCGGLDCEVVGNGENFSSGQRQLICVVRALVRESKVVILDEATAYVDLETDKIIQKIVKEYLKDKIVLSIAHRLDTVLGMDKVLVMDQGKVSEFGTKEELMKMEGGIFRELAIKANIIIETE